MQDLIQIFEEKLKKTELPSYDYFLPLLDSCISILENESPSYRPLANDKKAGGLIDFSEKEENIPVIIVPDLHGRGKFIIDLLKYRFPVNQKNPSLKTCENLTVLQCLEKSLLYICCVGDIFHSETRGKERWVKAFEAYSHGNLVNDFMKAEMLENLSLLEMLLVLKSAFASHFHILKGNHENVLNEMRVKPFGNVPFRKFCDEGNMVADFLQNYYDDLILHEINCFEKSLPVCAVFKNCIVSHAEPYETYTRKQIVNYHKEENSVVFGLTWTANDKAQSGSVESTMKNLLHKKNLENCIWIGGHRPVIGNYASRQGGKYIQIHNPDEENVAIVAPEEIFSTVHGIISVER
ncbi:MAG: hypothetical protein KBT11_06890 [Treponema sp.]|nr:hypothetical protein [Candidatus Treponema equifaecale]